MKVLINPAKEQTGSGLTASVTWQNPSTRSAMNMLFGVKTQIERLVHIEITEEGITARLDHVPQNVKADPERALPDDVTEADNRREMVRNCDSRRDGIVNTALGGIMSDSLPVSSETHDVRIMELILMPKGQSTFSEMATRISIDDEAAGEFVKVSQCSAHTDLAKSIAIDPGEWPKLRECIDYMIGQCRSE
jgi:hypothetical protein